MLLVLLSPAVALAHPGHQHAGSSGWHVVGWPAAWTAALLPAAALTLFVVGRRTWKLLRRRPGF